MSIYFEKAKELGELILKSDESINLADARADFEQSPDAIFKMDEYTKYQTKIREGISKGEITQEQLKIESTKLQSMAIELKQDPVIGALLFTENDFNTFVNSCMNVIKTTIMGDPKEGSCGCSSSCGGGCGNCK